MGDFTITIAAEHYAYPELYGTSETKVSILKSTYNKALWLITLGIILLGFFIMVAYLKSNKKNA